MQQRKLKVCETYRSYTKKNSQFFDKIPKITLTGSWLEAAGFNIGNNVTVSTDKMGRIIIEKIEK